MLCRTSTIQHKDSGVSLTTPLLIPSFSSKGFARSKRDGKSEIGKILKTMDEFLTEIFLRSRLKTIFFLFDPFEQQVDHSNLDQGFAMVGQHLIISGMSAKIHQPRKRALDDPTAW